MTREEVIKWFKENPFMHKDHEPFQMAIEALEKENNVIDRVLETVAKNKRISFQVLYTGAPNPAAFAAIEAIENYVDRLRRDILEMKEGEQE